jgi:hypothetical protein
MKTKTVPVTIKLGDIDLCGYKLKNGYYAAPGLFRLINTDIYRYKEYWYWLGSNGIPDLKNCKFWGHKGDVFLSFQGNKLCHRYVNPADPETELYVAIPCDLQSVMEFCVIGKIVSDKAMLRLNKVLDRSCLINGGYVPALITGGLLKDTSICLHKVEGTNPVAKKKKKSSITPKGNIIEKSPITPTRTIIDVTLGYNEFVYLVKLDAHLKPGFTRNIGGRLKSFETTNARVELIKAVHGTIQDEKHLHSILGSKVRELYDFKDEQRIIREMMRIPRISIVSVSVR